MSGGCDWRGRGNLSRLALGHTASEDAVGIVLEFFETAEAAEIVGRALVIERALGLGGINLHPADRVCDFTNHDVSRRTTEAVIHGGYGFLRATITVCTDIGLFFALRSRVIGWPLSTSCLRSLVVHPSWRVIGLTTLLIAAIRGFELWKC